MLLSQDFKEFLQSLNANQVEYLIVGGYAVAFHGHPRYTKDLDIWLAADKSNIENLLRALTAFGFSSFALNVDDFNDPEQIIQLGYPPNRIDLLTGLKGIDFKGCYKNKIEVDIEGVKAHFIHLDDLKKNKRATGRFQDLADLENLE